MRRTGIVCLCFFLLFLTACAGPSVVPEAPQEETAPTETAAPAPVPTETPEAVKTAAADPTPEASRQETDAKEEETLKLTVDGRQVQVLWEDNEAVAELRRAAGSEKILVKTSRYGGFEQVGSLGMKLPRQDAQTLTGPGDIMLYSGDQIVLFFGENSWAYTPLGKISGLSVEELRELLDRDACEVILAFE